MNTKKVRLWDHWLPKVFVKPHIPFSSIAIANLKTCVHILVQFFLVIQNWVESSKPADCSSCKSTSENERKIRQKELDFLLSAEWGFQEVLLF